MTNHLTLHLAAVRELRIEALYTKDHTAEEGLAHPADLFLTARRFNRRFRVADLFTLKRGRRLVTRCLLEERPQEDFAKALITATPEMDVIWRRIGRIELVPSHHRQRPALEGDHIVEGASVHHRSAPLNLDDLMRPRPVLKGGSLPIERDGSIRGTDKQARSLGHGVADPREHLM